MSAGALFLKLEEEGIVAAVQKSSENLDRAQDDVVLDFSSVRRVNSGDLRALEAFVQVADEKAVKIVLRGVNVDAYKVLKLIKLTQRFSFVT
jgi:anti-anti-sigma regulatory factor